MTLHIADVASYQGTLTVAQLKAAGFGAINVKISHGLTQKSVHPAASTYVKQARDLKLRLSCFHWLDGSASGEQQADYAYSRMVALGLDAPGVAHVVDVEDSKSPPTQAMIADYVRRMVARTQRWVIIYTGDWYWPRTWAPPSSYLWSAPAAGYLEAYPGDASQHWLGYAGWPELAVMQYRVAAVAGVQVSQSAVRSMETWRAMTGEPMPVYSIPASTSLVNEFNAISPNRDKASDGTIGDLAHSESVSDHNLDESGNTGSASDTDNLDEVHARDVDSSGPWPPGWSMERFVWTVLYRCRKGTERRLRYVIFNRRIWRKSNGWVTEDYSGSNPHDKHAHFSFEYGSGSGSSNPENQTQPWGMLAAVEGDDMTPAEMTAWAKSAEGKAALAAAVAGEVRDEILGTALVDPYDKSEKPRSVSVANWLRYSPSRGQVEGVSNSVKTSGSEIMALLVALANRDEVDSAALAAALAGPLASALVPLLPEDKEVSAATLRDAFRELLAGEGSEAEQA
jgi:hypothetical protein